MKTMKCLLLVLMVLALLGPMLGCINVQAPEKVEVNGNGDAQSWKEVGESYKRQYTNGEQED